MKTSTIDELVERGSISPTPIQNGSGGENVNIDVDYVSLMKHSIPIRRYFPDARSSRDGRQCPVLAIHDLFDHSAWFLAIAEQLCSHGRELFAFDRYGSGLSEAARGECRHFSTLVQETSASVDYAIEKTGAAAVHLIGRGFGALPATVFALSHPERCRSLTLLNPLFYTELFASDGCTTVAQHFPKLCALPSLVFEPHSLTEIPDIQVVLDRDILINKRVSSRTRTEARRMLSIVERNVSLLTLPTSMMLSGKNPLIAEGPQRSFFEQIPSRCTALLHFPKSRHAIELGPEKERFLRDLSRWLQEVDGYYSSESGEFYLHDYANDQFAERTADAG